MMIEPQKLDYVASDFDPPAILAKFSDQEEPIEFPVSKVSSKIKIHIHFNYCILFFIFVVYFNSWCLTLDN